MYTPDIYCYWVGAVLNLNPSLYKPGKPEVPCLSFELGTHDPKSQTPASAQQIGNSGTSLKEPNGLLSCIGLGFRV